MIINGIELAASFEYEITDQVCQLKKRGIFPCLSVIQVGDHLPSQIYVKRKKDKAAFLGIEADHDHFPSNVDSAVVKRRIQELNQNPLVHGILVQLPLPPHWDTEDILSTIDPNKDVDGLHPINLGLLVKERPNLIPCTPMGCLQLIQSVESNLSGKLAVIIGRSALVGKPAGLLLLQKDVTVISCHSKTQNLSELCIQADILISAVGKPNLVQKEWVKEGAIVIDVGINRSPEDPSRIVGDVDFENVIKKAKAITPVPGGVGPMTIMNLMRNTVQAAENLTKK